jgi:predicted RNA methylase
VSVADAEGGLVRRARLTARQQVLDLLCPALRGNLSPIKIAVADTATRLVFERRLKTHTSELISLAALGVASEYRVHYQPSPWLTLPRVLRRSDIGPDDVFIDYGCGMGRMVLEAGLHYPFKRVIGLELATDLARVARENVQRNVKRLRCGQVEIVEGDALAYRLPDDVTVAYFYNPFYGPILARVIQELVDSVDRAPRRLRIIYNNPVEEQLLLSTGRIRRIASGRSFWFSRRVDAGLAVYEVLPAT